MLCSRASCLASARSESSSPDQALKYCTSEKLRLTIQRSVPYAPRTSSTNSWRTWSTPVRTALRCSSVARRSASRPSFPAFMVSGRSLESTDEDTVKSLLVRLPTCTSRDFTDGCGSPFDHRRHGQSAAEALVECSPNSDERGMRPGRRTDACCGRDERDHVQKV